MRPIVIGALSIVLLCRPLRADDLFSLSAISTSGTPTVATASGSSLPELVEDVYQSQSEFAALAGRGFTASLRYGFYEGLPIDIGDFKSESDISQQILKNGVAIVKNWNSAFLDVGITYTNFLNDSAIDGYLSPTIGAGFRWSDSAGVRVGYQGDFRRGFHRAQRKRSGIF